MNVYDAERMADVLAPLGFEAVDSPDAADLVILNTCHIREKATEKVFSDLGRLREAREGRLAQGQDMLIAVAGCVAQAEGAEIARRAPQVDMVFGPQTYHRLPELLASAEARRAAIAPHHKSAQGARVLDADFPAEDKFDHLPKARRMRGPAAFLTIQEGCDKFCSFCVVPYTRGAEVSRPMDAILDEARGLLDQGAVEITLLGQNVNAYHGLNARGQSATFAELLFALAALPGLKRLRYTTSHPLEMDDGLIAAHRELDLLMPFLHLPVQAGSDRILRAMNRRHTAADYMRIIDKLRAARPDIALSSDFIVGFPGESEEDFQATLDLVRDVGFAQAFSFKYSARPGTPAAALEADPALAVPEAEKVERLARLQELLGQQQYRFNQSCVGQTIPVLVDRVGRKPGQMLGRSPWLQSVVIEEPVAIGELIDLSIAHAGPVALVAAPRAQRAA